MFVLFGALLATHGITSASAEEPADSEFSDTAKKEAKTKKSSKKSSRKAARATLSRVRSCGDLEEYLTEAVVQQLVDSNYSYYGWGRGGVRVADDAAVAESSAAPAKSGSTAGAGASPDSYSTTNVQEQGVDEADFVKTDGKYIYILQGKRFSIVRSFPFDEAKELASIELNGYGQSMFLHGDRVVLATNVWNGGGMYGSFASGQATQLTFVDVSDREEPEVERTIELEGYMTSGRMIDGEAYFVVTSTPVLNQEVWNAGWNAMSDSEFPQMDWNATPEDQEKIKRKMRKKLRPVIKEVIGNVDADKIMPAFVETPGGGKAGEAQPLLSCRDLYKPRTGAQLGMLSVVNIDLAEKDSQPSAGGIMASGWQVYASERNMYITMSNRWGWWGWGWNSDPSSEIHKFGLNPGEGKPEYLASGKVDGWMLNQFSMSEHDGFLRVATTTNGSWDPRTGELQNQAANHVFVMQEDGRRLRTVGSIRNIAPGEQIQSARFMGDRGYLVTFERIDPLFTIDFSNPRKPELRGELKIPGFSSYMHPLGEDHILAVGMDGTETGQLTGMQVSIFDISDFDNPKLTHKHKLGNERWSWSEAMWNHHAFTFHNGRLAVPASWWDGRWNGAQYEDLDQFNGLIVMDIDAEDGIEEIGRVDHSDLAYEACIAQQSNNTWNAQYNSHWNPQQYCANPQNNMWYANMRRSIVIDDGIVSISSAGMKFNMLEDLDETLATIPLPTVW